MELRWLLQNSLPHGSTYTYRLVNGTGVRSPIQSGVAWGIQDVLLLPVPFPNLRYHTVPLMCSVLSMLQGQKHLSFAARPAVRRGGGMLVKSFRSDSGYSIGLLFPARPVVCQGLGSTCTAKGGLEALQEP